MIKENDSKGANNALKKLGMLWQADFSSNRKTYLNSIIPKIISGDFSNLSNKERALMIDIRASLDDKEWKMLDVFIIQAIEDAKNNLYREKIISGAIKLLSDDDFSGFEKLFNKNQTLLYEIKNSYNAALKKHIQVLKENIAKIGFNDFKKAVSFFYKASKKLPDNKKRELGLFLESVERLIFMLQEGKFTDGDNFFRSKKMLAENEYEKLKAKYVLEYFKGQKIDYDKALAISSIRNNVLLQSRAGSGKTSTICLKTRFLIEKYDINPDEILILAFNRDAKTRIEEDLREKFNIKNFNCAKTFHSFSKSIFDEMKIIDEKPGKNLINRVIEKVLDTKENKKLFYDFYKTSLDIPSKKEYRISNSAKVTFLKDLSQITLRGEIVKSHGEKYIADFLFESGIYYEYEKSITFSDEEKNALNIDDGWKIYHPDFYIKYEGKEFYLEHWGADENELSEDYFGKKGVISDVSKYVKNMHIKRKYFKKKGIPLIETRAKDSQIRKNFEQTLSETLLKFGIQAKKLPDEVLYEKTKEINIKGFQKTIEGFISTVKKSCFGPDFIESKLKDETISKRTKIFLKIGYTVLDEYQKELKKLSMVDFDDLIINASKRIVETKGEACFKLKNGEIKKVKSLKYLLIDEYQDFSKLFFDLILAIKTFNPDLKIFATGDDWQAINGFAGSNLYYFKNFETLFYNSKTYTLPNNYRSYKKIVNTSNTLMMGDGIPSKAIKEDDGEVYKINVSKTFINKENPGDLAYTFKNERSMIKAKYLKTIHRLIRLHPNDNFLILSRLNKISGVNLEYGFISKLLSMKTVDEKKIRAMTIHKSKGLESDIVIVLRAINGIIPFIHPDFEIMTALNKSYDDILDEEKRLFYVALTRARKKVFILTENNLESAYLKDLNLKEINFRNLNFDD